MELPHEVRGPLLAVIGSLESAGLRPMAVGALATFAWGEPRTTRDIDLAVRGSEAEVGAVLRSTGFDVKGPFSTTWGLRFVVEAPAGLPVDVFLSDRDDEFRRAREVSVSGLPLRVLSPEDLIASKLSNASRFPIERATDIDDAAGVLFRSWQIIDRDAVATGCRQAKCEGEWRDLQKKVAELRGKAGLAV
ncbi:MAG: hypothetical protein ACT4PT_03645 [Methanobacteriota archaeon]